jgi:hypothetical protein
MTQRPDHAGNHPEFAAIGSRRDVRGDAQDRDVSIIYEVLDMGTGITDAEGEIACSGAGIPAFIGVLDKSVKVMVAKFGDQTSIPATSLPPTIPIMAASRT